MRRRVLPCSQYLEGCWGTRYLYTVGYCIANYRDSRGRCKFSAGEVLHVFCITQTLLCLDCAVALSLCAHTPLAFRTAHSYFLPFCLCMFLFPFLSLARFALTRDTEAFLLGPANRRICQPRPTMCAHQLSKFMQRHIPASC